MVIIWLMMVNNKLVGGWALALGKIWVKDESVGQLGWFSIPKCFLESHNPWTMVPVSTNQLCVDEFCLAKCSSLKKTGPCCGKKCLGSSGSILVPWEPSNPWIFAPKHEETWVFSDKCSIWKPSQEKWSILDTPRFPDHLFPLVRIYIYTYISTCIPKIKLLKFPGCTGLTVGHRSSASCARWSNIYFVLGSSCSNSCRLRHPQTINGHATGNDWLEVPIPYILGLFFRPV